MHLEAGNIQNFKDAYSHKSMNLNIITADSLAGHYLQRLYQSFTSNL